MGYGTLANSFARSLVVLVWLEFGAGVVQAQTYEIDWVTIGDVGNPAYDDPRDGDLDGRGSVGYEYRIGRFEVTTGQWMEFVNTFSTQSDDMAFFGKPVFWGAATDPDYDGPGRHYVLRTDIETPEMLPVGGISWRESAMFANWLHNNRSSDLSAIEDGAYDTSTFTTNGDGTYNDQWTHHPDARFWIPTLDEWAKAAHYDPDRYGDGQGGWWGYSISADEQPIYGPPGEGQANAGFELPRSGEWDIPLGAYEDVRSPWGLFDVAGGAQEWIEEVVWPDHPNNRALDGSYAGSPDYIAEVDDRVSRLGGSLPPWSRGHYTGLRIAAAVPATGTVTMLAIALVGAGAIRRRR